MLSRKNRKEATKEASTNNKKKRRVRLYIWVLVGVFLISSITLGAGVSYTKHLLEDAPDWDPSVLLSTSETSIMYNEDGTVEITKLHGPENRTTIEIEKIPQVIKDAFLATEDIRFYQHNGVDFRALARAVYANYKDGFGSEGASTLTQQLVKLAFLSPEKSIKRKAQEAVLAMELERNYTKDEIFEMYLNRIYFGHGAYGVEAAAQLYFNKSVTELTIPEAAMIAGLPQRPNGLSPFNNIERAKDRRNQVIKKMERYEFITPKEAEIALADNFESLNTDRVKKDEAGNKINYPHPYFVEYVIEQLIARYGSNQVFNGGLRIYTTIDFDIQKQTEQAINNDKNYPQTVIDSNGNKQPQGAAVVIDPKTGYIKAIAGGRGADHSQKRVLNRATQSYRQPGSSIKPILAFAPAIETGSGAGSIVDDAPVKYGSWEPKNIGGGYKGPVTYRSALQWSYNVPAVKVMHQVGISKAKDMAEKMGLTINKKDGLASVLGGMTKGVTPLEISSAFGTFANNGIHVASTAIVRVEDSSGKVLYEHTAKKTKAMKDSTAYIVTDMLRTAVNSGTGSRAKFSSWQVAGKTGTTNDHKDTWFVGYTPELVGAVWIGHDNPKETQGKNYKVYGGSNSAQIWREIMQGAHKGLPVKNFSKPGGIFYASVCSISGKKPSELCSKEHIISDMFPAGGGPKGTCDVHVEIEVCDEHNLLPSENCPKVVKKSFISAKATDAKIDGVEPTEKCKLHSPENTVSKAVITHNGKEYLAKVPGPNDEGGCPPDQVTTKRYSKGSEPKEKCPLPEHQVKPKEPALAPQGKLNPWNNSKKPI